MKPFELPQKSVKIKILVTFSLIQFSEMHGTGRVKQIPAEVQQVSAIPNKVVPVS